MDINHPYSADREHFGLRLWADLTYDEVSDTHRKIVRVGEVIRNTPAAQYNHDHPANELVYGNNVLELDGIEASSSRCIRNVDEVDKHNLVSYLMKNPFKIKIETREQMSVQIEGDIHGYVAKLHHDCGHPSTEKMIDTLMREGCSDYSLDIARKKSDVQRVCSRTSTQPWM